MHSSRMRTVRSSSHLLGRGVSALVHAGIHPLGLGLDTPMPGPGHPMPGPGHPLALGLDTPPDLGLDSPPVDRMTDRCKNITFPQLHLWMVFTSDIRLESHLADR